MVMPESPETDQRLEAPRSSILDFRVFGLASLLTFLIFALFPFTQYLGSQSRELVELRRVDLAPPPPPPPPDEPPPPEPPPREEPPPPDLSEPPPPLDLSQLEMVLNPGMGSDFAGAFSVAGFDVAGDAASEIMIFEISDLDQTPRMLQGNRPVYPSDQLRQRSEGSVRLRVLLDENGSLQVQSILSSTHSAFERPAVVAAESFRYTPPTKNGRPARTVFVLPIEFRIN
jgi:periplasmic protein TonB